MLLLFVLLLPRQQNVSPWGLFPSGETNEQKVTGGKIRWIGRVEHGSHAVFGQTLLNAQIGLGKCTPKSPIVKWANALKESSKKKKNSPKRNAASHNYASWYTDADGFLEHSPSTGSLHYKGPILQKIIDNSGFGGPPSYCVVFILYDN